MKTFEQRMREIADKLSGPARAFVPAALITLLIDICKTVDQLQEKKE